MESQHQINYLLSPLQETMVFHSLSQPHSGIYLEQIIGNFRESLDVEAFCQSWQQVMKRHPSLRTSFDWSNSQQMFQFFHEDVSLPFSQQDWQGLSSKEQKEKLDFYLQQDRYNGFDLQQPPLMRLALFQLGEAHYQLVWTVHHSIIDGRSFVVVLQEVFGIYEFVCNNEALNLPEARPYQDYIEHRSKLNVADARQYWQDLLAGFSEPNQILLPSPLKKESAECSEYVSLPTSTCKYQTQKLKLSETTTATLKSLAEAEEITLNTLLQGAWALLLARYGNTNDVVFVATRACHKSVVADTENMVGLLINTVPVRVQLNIKTLVLPWLQDLRSQWVRLRDYENTPFEVINDSSELLPGMTLFNSLVIYDHGDLNTTLQSLGGNWGQREFELIDFVDMPLTLRGYGGKELQLSLTYDTEKFSTPGIARMLDSVQVILESFAHNCADMTLGEVPYLSEGEKKLLLEDFPQTEIINSHRDKTYPELFVSQVNKTPEAVAVIHEGNQLTYEELNSQSNQLAHYLGKLGITPDTIVGVFLERSMVTTIAYLGILKAGGAYLPLDVNYPQERLSYMVTDSCTGVILTQSSLLDKIPPNNAQVISLDTEWAKIAQESSTNPELKITPENLAYVIYTSGSTGKPKGVMIVHKGMVNHNLAMVNRSAIQPRDVVLQFSSLSFDIAIKEIFPTWLQGATLVLRPENLLTVTNLLQFLEENQITILSLPTGFWHEMVRSMANLQYTLPESVRLVIVGGEKSHKSSYQTWVSMVGENRRWLNTYGPTEITVSATSYEPGSAPHNHKLLTEIPIGRPLTNVKVYILNSQLQPVPLGVPGELYIGGDGVARGYLYRPELTQERFINSPFSPEKKLYQTGDLVRYLEDGYIEYLGRIDNQVKLHGFRIELGEIEAFLTKHFDIQEALVIIREDSPGEKRMCAYLVSNSLQKDNLQEIRNSLGKELPKYMIPADFVFLETLPLTHNGKVNRRALPVPSQEKLAEDNEIVLPQDELELRLVKIWEKVLGVKHLSVTDDFFDLGGSSLLAVRLFAQIQQHFGQSISLARLFQFPTVKGLASLLRQDNHNLKPSALVLLNPGKQKTPLFFINSIGYAQKLAQHLKQDLPLHGLSIFGLTDSFSPAELPKLTLQEIAKLFIEDIQSVQPEPPYRLVTYCGDTRLTWEIAQQLSSQNKEVSFLGFIDFFWGYGEQNMLAFHLNNFRKFGLHYLVEKTSRRFTSFNEKRLLIHKKMSVKGNEVVDELSSKTVRDIKFLEHFHRASNTYVPGSYSGKINLFLSSELRDRKLPKLTNLATGGMEIQEIPGYHHSIFSEPHIKVLGEKLNLGLENS